MSRTCHLTCLLILTATAADAAEYFVDQALRAPCSNYDVERRSCGNGATATAFNEFNAVMDRLEPGDIVRLREGTYQQLDITVSGEADRPVTFAAYADERVVIRDRGRVGINLIQQQHVVIRGVQVRNSVGFARVEESTGITFEGNDFFNAIASGTTGALKLVRSTENRILNNSFEQGSDLLLLQDDSDRNLVAGNVFRTADHSLISIRCSNRNVIRGNELINEDQKALEIFDCEGISDAPVRLDSTVGNLIERNRFVGTAASDRDHKFNAIQHGGQETIVRYNVFSQNLGGGVNFQYYPDESLHVHGNRLYHNTFVDNRCGAIIGQDGARKQMYDNRVRNNLLFRNVDCDGGPVSINVASERSVGVHSNLSAERDPGFRDAANLDFCLESPSSAVDSAEFLSRVRKAGAGRKIPIDDASWFFPGIGMVDGDEVRLEGSDQAARVVEIDVDANVLTVDRDLEFSKGQGIHTAFLGRAPDFGALEYGAMECDAVANRRQLFFPQ